MKIFNADQIREADKMTMERQHISSVQLMERAGYRLFQHLHEGFVPVKGEVLVLAGMGNNGGDGLVVARYLRKARQKVKVIMVNFSSGRSEDLKVNCQKFVAAGGEIVELHEGDPVPKPGRNDLVIDAIFGIGLNRRPPLWVEELIFQINNSAARVVAVDIPSGLYMTGLPENPEAVIRAHHTFTFELPKLVFLLPQTGGYTGNWSLVSIDQDKDFIDNTPTKYYYSNQEDMAQLLRPRARFSHKGTYGHVLIVGGSYGKIGAALMSAEAALTSGSGLVSALVPHCGYEIFQTAVPEVMCVPVEDEKILTQMNPGFVPDVVAMGPGMGKEQSTTGAMKRFLKGYRGALVLDADALNILAEEQEIWGLLPEGTVLTPHPGEFKRMAGSWDNDFEMMERAMRLAGERKVIMVLKGAYTMVTDGERMYFNASGNPGMATGGSGDVLTGIISALRGQGYPAFEAARLGVYLHGLSGDIAIRETSVWSLTATDIIDFLGDAFLHLDSQRK
ncbi:NAD(P)H-hydrate dehydratase [Robertkochia flava]|uniref:NAD(P)H-hydrate dehydratase n=1 Tax=Robertkochia flava TaxID=3447986 RepID=UPI001CCDCE5D|nr:NAD(P)H-hydrate dehydratase [Robertkochia marina]